MKLLLTIPFFFFSAFTMYSQSSAEQYSYFPKENIAKINPLSIPFGKLSLGYEYIMENNKSWAIQVGLPVATEINEQVVEEMEADDLTFNSTEYSGFSIRPSYRMYLSSKKRGPKGLYFEPSLKYQNYKLDVSSVYDDDGEDVPVDFDATLNTFGAGLQLGSQWIISNSFVIDFFFLGPEMNLGSVEATLVDNGQISDENRQDLENDIEEDYNDLPLVGDIEVTTTEDQISAKTTNTLIPGLRFGINLGYSF